jgi:hypothetical protein
VQASAHVRRVGEGGEGAPRCGGRSQRTGPMPALLYGWTVRLATKRLMSGLPGLSLTRSRQRRAPRRMLRRKRMRAASQRLREGGKVRRGVQVPKMSDFAPKPVVRLISSEGCELPALSCRSRSCFLRGHMLCEGEERRNERGGGWWIGGRHGRPAAKGRRAFQP